MPRLSAKTWANARRRRSCRADFLAAGYVSVIAVGNPADVHQWCKNEYKNNYYYAGDEFWFRNKEEAIFFKLAWG